MYRRIRDLREDHDLTQQQIASSLNITPTTYSRYENRILDVPTIVLIQLANFYEVSIDYLWARQIRRNVKSKNNLFLRKLRNKLFLADPIYIQNEYFHF